MAQALIDFNVDLFIYIQHTSLDTHAGLLQIIISPQAASIYKLRSMEGRWGSYVVVMEKFDGKKRGDGDFQIVVMDFFYSIFDPKLN